MIHRHISNLLDKRHYGWAIFGLAFTNLTAEGGMKNSAPVVFLALRDHFGRSAAATAGIFSVAGLTGALISPFLGKLLDRLGPRLLFPAGALFILIGYLASSLVSDFWQLIILYGVVATIGETTISSFTATAILAPWFPHSRGRVLGLADAGNPLGQGIFTPLTQLLISAFGWRLAFRIIGPAFFLMVAPANFLFQRRPPVPPSPTEDAEETEEEASGALGSSQAHRPADDSEAQVPGGPVARAAIRKNSGQIPEPLRSATLWCLVSARCLAAMGTNLTTIHMVAFFVAAGYSELQAASTIGAVGLLSLAGRPIAGAISDGLGRELVYTVGLGMQVSAIVLILLSGDGHRLWPMALFVGLSGLSDGISGLMVGAKAADVFPARSLGSVMGLVHGGRGLGIMAGPILGGLLFDLKGDYVAAFTVAVSLVLLAVLLMWAARFTVPTSAARLSAG
ncbi:MAG: MFS transporter [Chloroflexi bacterium]|nr:MFS transporter [Chloroflexota bacterium]